MPTTKTQIRRHIRKLRKQLSAQQQQDAAEQLANHVVKRVQSHLFEQRQAHQCKRVALFLSMDGEIGTQPAIEQLWQASIEVYIPLIHPFNPQHLIFIRYQPHTPLVRSKLGMLEPLPDCSQVCPLAQLDIVFTPLVAFDSSGNRLGMGGGFYDRTLEYHYKQQRVTPAIIGIAHNCQKVDEVPTEPWDIPLKEIITPSEHYQL